MNTLPPPNEPPETMTEPVSLDFTEEITGIQMGDDYIRRTIAIQEARRLLAGTSKLFATDPIPDVGSLIVLADWLLGEEDLPTLDVLDGEGNVVARVET